MESTAKGSQKGETQGGLGRLGQLTLIVNHGAPSIHGNFCKGRESCLFFNLLFQKHPEIGTVVNFDPQAPQETGFMGINRPNNATYVYR